MGSCDHHKLMQFHGLRIRVIVATTTTLVSEPDSQPKGGGGVWYSCNLQSAVEFRWHESDWLIAMYCIVALHRWLSVETVK